MKLLLAALMLSVLAGCVVYDRGPHHDHRGYGWSAQNNGHNQGYHGPRGQGGYDGGYGGGH